MLSPALVAHLVLPVLVALAGATSTALVLHVALGHAMRARGLARWRLRDTLLVSPLLVLGLAAAFGALAHATARAAGDANRGALDGPHLAGALTLALGAFVVAGFGARAIGKLY